MLAVLAWLGVTLSVSFGSAVLPVISVELFVLGMASSQPGVHWLAIGAVVATGQMAGKLLHFLCARGSLKLPRVLRLEFLRRRAQSERPPSPARDRWQARTKKLRMRVEAMRERCHRHPHWMFGTYSVSSVLGVPPFMAITVLAGVVRMRLSLFLSAGFLGRFARYSALAATPAMFAGLVPG